MTDPILKAGFSGTVLGCAVGDALGAPYEGIGANRLFQGGEPPGFTSIPGMPRGQYTDDTQMTLAIVKAILKDGKIKGESVADEFATLWRSGEVVGPGASCSEAMWRYIRDEANWDDCGTGPGRAGNGAAMRAGPIGLWNYDAPERLISDARAVSIITHKDERAVAGATAVALAVAYLLTSDRVSSDEFIRYVNRGIADYSPDFARAVEKLPALLAEQESRAAGVIVNEGWTGHDVSFGVTPFVVPTVMASLYAFLRYPHDFSRAVCTVINMGGDVDTTAAITGAISGAFNGADAIPVHLRETVRDGRAIEKLACELFSEKQNIGYSR